MHSTLRSASRTVCLLVIAIFPQAVLVANELSLVQFPAQGRFLTGLSLARNASTWLILGTDGQLHYLENTASFAEVTPIEGEFTPATSMELRASLTREFGPSFEVVPTKHFLIVQPRGRGTKWPETFEGLHRQFTHQLKKRGVQVRTGKFPMVAVVFPDRTSLHTELARQKLPTASIAGIYIANSNRVYTHDESSTGTTLAVLRHEAAHQSAFNSNIHSRLNTTPKWITEGLGMLFEPPAMADGRPSTFAQRVNEEALLQLSSRYRDPQQSLASDIRRLVTHDTMFDQSREVQSAYAISWLMMFYLSERRPNAFAQTLNHTAARPPFVEYSPTQRLQDFQRITGLSPDQLAQEAKRFLEPAGKP
jgi:hypothetical protein